MYKIIATQSFFKEHKVFFDNVELHKFEKFKKRLESNPYLGKPLRVNFVREFKTQKGKRAYFIIYEEFKIIIFVGISNKKNQKSIIKWIFSNLDKYWYLAYYNS